MKIQTQILTDLGGKLDGLCPLSVDNIYSEGVSH